MRDTSSTQYVNAKKPLIAVSSELFTKKPEAQIRVTSLGVKMLSLIDDSPADIQKTQAVQMMGYFIQGCIFDLKSNSIGLILY